MIASSQTVAGSVTQEAVVQGGAIPQETKQERITTLALFVVFAVLYLTTLCRTVYVGDSGEIVNAIFTNSIIHPPGYPIFALLGHLSLICIPFGEPAFRIGCVVAVAAAAAVAILYRLCRELGVGRYSSLIAAAGFGTCYAFWSQCVRVEVYSLHAVFYGLALLGALRYGRTGSLKALFMAAIAFSLGLAHHLTIVMFLPALLILAGLRLWTTPKAVGRVLGVIATILAVGPPFYLLLMYWAKQEPILNWSRPVNWDGLLTHVTARVYAQNLKTPTPEKVMAHLTEAGRSLGDSLLWIGIPIALFGLYCLWQRNRQAAIGLVVAALAITIYNQGYDINDILVYYLPVCTVAFLFLACGLEAITRNLKKREYGLLIGYACCLCLPVVQLTRNFVPCNLSQVTFVREFARQKLEHCDKDGVLILQNDDDISPVHYMHYVMGVRPDVLLMDRNLFDGAYNHYAVDKSAWYLYSLRTRGIDISTEVPQDPEERHRLGSDGALIALLTKLKATRPIHTTFLDDRRDEERARDAAAGTRTLTPLVRWFYTGFDPVPQGMVIHLQEKNSTRTLKELIARNKQLWENTTLPDTSHLRADGEMDASYFTDYSATMLLLYGHLYELDRSPNEAAQVYTLAEQVAPNNASVQKTWSEFRKKYQQVQADANTP